MPRQGFIPLCIDVEQAAGKQKRLPRHGVGTAFEQFLLSSRMRFRMCD